MLTCFSDEVKRNFDETLMNGVLIAEIWVANNTVIMVAKLLL
jgi:hypothetical protein